MNNLEQLTCTREQSEELIKNGINPVSFLWHTWEPNPEKTKEGEILPAFINDVCLLSSPVFVPGANVPAWTKAEIDGMIGPDLEKPDVFTSREKMKTQKPLHFPVKYLERMKIFATGAQASADVLIFMLQKNHLIAAEVNERYSQMFKPVL